MSIFKHKYLKLNIGLVKENYVIIKKEDKKIWEDRDFIRIRKYPIFRYKPNASEIIMLGVPQKIEEFGLETLKGSKIIDVCTCGGTYGMGGPGFFELKLQGEYGIRFLTYCIWFAGEQVLFDGSILECHPDYIEKYHPVLSSIDDYEKFSSTFTNMSIKDICLSKDSIEIILLDSNEKEHFIQSYKFSEKFPEQAGTGQKRNSYDEGEMKDYWLVTYNKTVLKV